MTHVDPAFSVIFDLEINNSRLQKERIIATQAAEGNNVFFQGCAMALDCMVTFGVKKVPKKTTDTGFGLSWEEFLRGATALINREVTGNAARNLISQMMDTATEDEWNGWYRRILIKDLRCGVSERTINKVVIKRYPQYVIPVFQCQLSHDHSGYESKVCGKKMLEVKLDGVRVITVVYPTGTVQQFSRNGKALENFVQIKNQFAAVAASLSEPMVFDGEVMSSSFQDLMKQVHRKDNVRADDAVLHLFDTVPLCSFQKGIYEVPQSQRTQMLTEWYEQHSNTLTNVTVLAHALVDLDSDEGQSLFYQHNQTALTNGYEGIMIKDPEAPYECKRTVHWLKMKPFIEVSLKVVAVEQGTGRNENRLGALVCAGQDQGLYIVVNVGSGFSDSDRDEYWLARDKLMGKIVEVRADAVTQNQDGTYSLRFPRFLRFRGFLSGEKL
jgi:DNA ligase-1